MHLEVLVKISCKLSAVPETRSTASVCAPCNTQYSVSAVPETRSTASVLSLKHAVQRQCCPCNTQYSVSVVPETRNTASVLSLKHAVTASVIEFADSGKNNSDPTCTVYHSCMVIRTHLLWFPDKLEL